MRIKAFVIRIFRQLHRDLRTLSIVFIAPILVFTVMYYIFQSEDPTPIVVVTNAPAEFIQQLNDTDLQIITKKKYSEKNLIQDKYTSWYDAEKQQLYVLNTNPKIALTIENSLTMLTPVNKRLKFKTFYTYGEKETTLYDTFNPKLIAFFVFFFVFLIAGIALLTERTTGTLERLFSTPIKRREVVLSYMIGYGSIAIIQMIIIVLFSIYILQMQSVGSVWLVLLICSLLVFIALSLGTFLSTFANSEFQMVQFIPLVIVPQIFFSGLFPLENMANWLQVIARFMPLYYGADAMDQVMFRGNGFIDIAYDLFFLLAFSLLFPLLNLFILRKYRRKLF